MIVVRPKDDNWNKGFIIEGHAEHGKHGQDIVCAAVSAIAQTIHMGIRMHSGTAYVMNPGNMLVEIYKQNNPFTVVLMRTFVHGIKTIAEQYPENVRIEGDLF